MAQYKTLKSVAHNFGHSFLSLMNYYKDDYTLGHIQKQMMLTGINKLEIDLLKNECTPKELLTEPIKKSIENYISWFPKLIKDSKSDVNLVNEAQLTIEFDLTKSRVCSFAPEYTENPYLCISRIVDNRGKEYKYEFNDWWFPEALVVEPKEPNLFARFKNSIKKLNKQSANML